jgi:hypothetical protein
VTPKLVPSVVSHVHVHGAEVIRDSAAAVVQCGQGVGECHRPWCLHQVSSHEVEQYSSAAADLKRLADALAVVGGGSSWYQLRGRVETPCHTRMNASGPEEESSGENSEWVPGAVLMGSHAIQTEWAEIEKLFRRTKPYCAIVLDRGCARAVKGMKIEAAAEVASGEDSAVTTRVMSGRIVKPDHGRGSQFCDIGYE